MNIVSSYILFVYTEYIGISSAVVGIVLSIGALIDGVSDFACGIVLDRFQTKHGKARHWLLWMAIPLGLSAGFLFACPASLPTLAKVLYLFIMYNIYCTVITFVRLPASTMVALIGTENKVKAAAGLCVALMATLGGTITGWVVTPLTELFGGQSQSGYVGALSVVAIISAIFCLLAFSLSRERVTEQRTADGRKEEKAGVFTMIKTLVTNKYWLLQMGGNLASDIAFGFMMGTMAYFCQYSLNDPSAVAGIMTVQGVPMLIGVLLGGVLNQKIEVRYVNIAGWILALAGSVVMCGFLTEYGYTMLLIGMGIKAFGQGVSNPSTLVFCSRIATYGHWKTGIRQEGMVFSGKDVMKKITSALATALLGVILAMAGYVAGSGTMPETAISAVNALYVYIPVVCTLISLVCYCCFNLTDARTQQMEKEIAQRELAAR